MKIRLFWFSLCVLGALCGSFLSLSAQQPPKLGGITVNLLGDDGSVVATTKTRDDGSYIFAGLELGTYQVQVVLQNNQLLPPTPSIALTKGMEVKGVNVTLPPRPASPTPPPPPPGDMSAPLSSPLRNPLPPRR